MVYSDGQLNCLSIVKQQFTEKVSRPFTIYQSMGPFIPLIALFDSFDELRG